LITRLQAFLNQPYPFNTDNRSYLKVILVFGVFVAVFLMVFQPFGVHQLDGINLVLVSCSFGLVTVFSLLLMLGIINLFPVEFHDDKWTLGKEIGYSLVNFFLVGNANYLFVEYGWYSRIISFDYGGMMFATFTVGFFPYLFMLLTQHMRLLNRNAKEAASLTKQLQPNLDKQKKNYVLKGENEGEVVSFELDQLLYVASSGNYIEVMLRTDSGLNKAVLRSTLARVEAVLEDENQVYRCHRTYLVNLNNVVKITGNSQGYRLLLNAWEDEIPVARTKNQEFKSRLNLIETQL
jgi:hypothetical protein